MLKHKFLIYIAILMTLSSCFKKEDAIQLPIGTSEIKTLFLGKDYEYDMYFDMSSGTYKQNTRSDWDIRFDASDTGWGVFINTESQIVVHQIGIFHLDEPHVFDTLKIMDMPDLIDKPNGRANASAFKDWKTYKLGNGASQLSGIYVLEFKTRTISEKFMRIQIVESSDSDYTCYFTPFYDAAGDSVLFNNNKTVIKKDKNQNYTYYSFKGSPHLVSGVEPDKNNWDFVFTRYIEFFDLGGGVYLPYPVTGVKSNTNKVVVAKDSLGDFGSIDASTISKYTFSSDANAIGYDWKSHAYSAGGTYSVNSKITYIIRDTDGYYYKMRFLDFYNEKAEKGYPKFEYVRIQ